MDENKKELFKKQYRFYGEHARRVDVLTNSFLDKHKFFERNIDVYLVAPLVGFLYGRKAERDNTKNPVTNSVYDESIFPDKMDECRNELLYNYQLIMLLDKNYEPDEDRRISKAFRNWDNPADMELYDCYVRGGVDVLYEKLIEDETNPKNYINRLYDFILEFEERFNESIDLEKVKQLL